MQGLQYNVPPRGIIVCFLYVNENFCGNLFVFETSFVCDFPKEQVNPGLIFLCEIQAGLELTYVYVTVPGLSCTSPLICINILLSCSRNRFTVRGKTIEFLPDFAWGRTTACCQDFGKGS